MTEDLQGLREKISSIDDRLLELFRERMQVARSIAKTKAGTDKPVYDSAREEELLTWAGSCCIGDDSLRAQNLMRTLMRLSRGAQYDLLRGFDESYELGRVLEGALREPPEVKTAVYQGPLSSYSSQACRLLFPEAEISSARTFADACDLVSDGAADIAVLPLENSTAGTVDDVYDLLIGHHLSIQTSLSLPISHCLMVKPGTRLEDIREVVSHPQALAQCSEAINRYGWQVVESLNTAYAAAHVAASEGADIAAIASSEAASENGLDVLLDNIANTTHNQTRFIAVGRQILITPQADRLSLVLRLPHQSGALASMLALFADRGINLSKIQSRPDPNQPWSYLFYLDADCLAGSEQALSALYQLSREMPYIKLLGRYNEKIETNFRHELLQGGRP